MSTVSRRSCGWSDQRSEFIRISNMLQDGQVSTANPDALAFVCFRPDIKPGRLAVGEPLANRVRSGRKQP
jgi:hypothetical protein